VYAEILCLDLTENYQSVREFFTKMDAGGGCENLIAEVCRLTDEQRDELVFRLLIERYARKPGLHDRIKPRLEAVRSVRLG